MKTRRNGLIAVLLVVLAVAALVAEYRFLSIETSFAAKSIIIFLFNMTLIALFVLVFFVTKALVKLSMERRRKALGYKFKTRIVVLFVGLTLVPSALLFFIASGIVTNYIDRWFDPQVSQPLEDSLDLAKNLYDREREKTIETARKLIRGEDSFDNISVSILTSPPEDASETVTSAFAGIEGTEVISGKDGDVIRAVIPEKINGRVTRVYVAEGVVPAVIVKKINSIRLSQERYLEMQKLKKPIKFNYLVILGFFAALIVFTAMWIALRISRGITEPIEVLAQATEDIVRGNLEVNIPIMRDDEIGMLVDSFNKMVVELKESKQSLESAYAESDRRRVCMESIIENVGSGVISLDNRGRLLMINIAACSILGMDPAVVLKGDMDYAGLLHHIGSEELRTFIRSVNLREARSINQQMTITTKGRKLIVRIFMTRLLLPGGEPTGILVVFDDLTEVIRAQQALTWQEVARRIAHEIKNPLTPIKLSAERILRKWVNKAEDMDSTIQKSTETIVREVDSLRRLVDEFSRFGKMPVIRKERILVQELLTEVADLYKTYGDVKISLNVPAEMSAVEVDPEQFKRVIINLFDNAITAMEQKGEISVTLSGGNGTGGYVTIEVADTGTGIDNEDKEKLFLPYFSKKKDGTGLGLAISHRIIAEHGGTLSVADNEPRGAKFIIQVPA